jgi:hypothetical protein
MPDKDRILPEHEAHFPRLTPDNYRKTSDEDAFYNCIAFSWGDSSTEEWWSPLNFPGFTWPEDIPRGLDVSVFVELYSRHGGFAECDSPDWEAGFEKVALYATEFHMFKHVARQKASGKWTSKLGEWEDIEHDSLEILGGSSYGEPVKILKRPMR